MAHIVKKKKKGAQGGGKEHHWLLTRFLLWFWMTYLGIDLYWNTQCSCSCPPHRTHLEKGPLLKINSLEHSHELWKPGALIQDTEDTKMPNSQSLLQVWRNWNLPFWKSAVTTDGLVRGFHHSSQLLIFKWARELVSLPFHKLGAKNLDFSPEVVQLQVSCSSPENTIVCCSKYFCTEPRRFISWKEVLWTNGWNLLNTPSGPWRRQGKGISAKAFPYS